MTQGVCMIDGCDSTAIGRGWCRKHYQRWWKFGDPLQGARRRRLCSIDGCNRKHYGRGWCRTHYMWWRLNGTPDDPAPTLEQRLLAKRIISASGCWLWAGKRNPAGYGRVTVNGRETFVHRVAHELWVGPIPDDCEVDHVAERGCSSTLCFNPAHLEAVPQYINNMRSTSPAAINARKTACRRGHPFDEANTYLKPKGRQCRACAREDQAARRARLNAGI